MIDMSPAMAFAEFLLRHRGIQVVPVEPRSKVPLVPFKDRRFTPRDLRDWQREWPDANFAIATGAIASVVGGDTDDFDAETWVGQHLPATEMMTRTRNAPSSVLRYPGGTVRARIGLWTRMGGYV